MKVVHEERREQNGRAAIHVADISKFQLVTIPFLVSLVLVVRGSISDWVSERSKRRSRLVDRSGAVGSVASFPNRTCGAP
jgi:hypothetical protein